MKAGKVSVNDLCQIGLLTAVIAVMSQIMIPMPYGVPMTLQTLAIPMAGILLGAKRGTISAMLYILIGAVGMPVFAGFNGGPGIVFGPTGGFILSFPILAYAAGAGAEKADKCWLWTGLIIGVLINYLCGVIYFSFYTSSDFITSFTVCVLLFIPTDIMKITAVGLFGIKIHKLIPLNI